jgi:hypothetical protein
VGELPCRGPEAPQSALRRCWARNRRLSNALALHDPLLWRLTSHRSLLGPGPPGPGRTGKKPSGTRPGTVRHEGSSVHVSESLTRGRDRTPRKQSERGNSVRVTGPAKPWITSTSGGQAKLRAVAESESRAGLERRVAGADPPVLWGRPGGAERSETDSGPTRRGMGNSTQRRSLDQRGRSAAERGVATLTPVNRPAPRAEVGEAHGTDEAGNDGGGTGPHFWALGKRARMRGLT